MKATFIWTAVFLGLGLLRNFTLSIEPSREFVLVQRVSGDTAVVVRSNGATYFIEKSGGCQSLSEFAARRVVIDSSARFLDAGSKLLLPEVDQSCRIVASRSLEPPDSPGS
ncbi:MAG: hypothetical protein ACM4AI_13740 [Acidobacteriota bacterium]